MTDQEGEPVLIYIKIKENQFIELFPSDNNKDQKSEREIGYAHLCLEVGDIEEIAEKMRNNNVELDVEPKQGKDGNYQCWIQDPDGNPIEFMQMMPDSLQYKNQ